MLYFKLKINLFYLFYSNSFLVYLNQRVKTTSEKHLMLIFNYFNLCMYAYPHTQRKKIFQKGLLNIAKKYLKYFKQIS